MTNGKLGNLSPYLERLAALELLKPDIPGIARITGVSEGVVRNFIRGGSISEAAKAQIQAAIGEGGEVPASSYRVAGDLVVKDLVGSIGVDDDEDDDFEEESKPVMRSTRTPPTTGLRITNATNLRLDRD